MGVVKTCGSVAELRRPELALRCFVRFVLAQAAVSYGMELMTALFQVAQGGTPTILSSSGLSVQSAASLPDELVSAIDSNAQAQGIKDI
ncbi:MAG: hypothetical protein LUH09_09715 [Clostridiales bacterium]|nr:hypothetical protein [Clostridiales bacterium]